MATLPYFVISPNTILSLIGLVRGGRPRPELVSEAAHNISFDVVIPAYNEARTIALALASLENQTVKPGMVVIFDDASNDRTRGVARRYAKKSSLNIRILRREISEGKTPSVRATAFGSDAAAIFVLDADTVLESEDYIERLLIELYRLPGIASVCGMVLPLRERDRDDIANLPAAQKFFRGRTSLGARETVPWRHQFARGITNMYREVIYFFVQKIVYRGEQALFGTIVNPVGCAVAYRRDYLLEVFDETRAELGDNLTTSEDIFLGFGFIDRGYHNVQVTDVTCRSEEPEFQSVPKQLFLWSSAWLQSGYYFPELIRSPLKSWTRHRARDAEKAFENRRQIKDPYREPFGRKFAVLRGRPVGWAVFLVLFEKISFPIVLIIMLALQWWEVLIVTLAAETLLYVSLIMLLGGENRFRYAGMGILVTPIRYSSILWDAVTISRFAIDLIRPGGKDRWRK